MNEFSGSPKGGPEASRVLITCELIGNANSWASAKFETPGMWPAVSMLTSSPGDSAAPKL